MALKPVFGIALGWMLMLVQPVWAASTDELVRQTQAVQQAAGALDARITKLESMTQQNQQLLGLLQEVEALKLEVARLRGQSEVQTHQLETLGKRQTDLYVDLDQRIADLGKSGGPASVNVNEAAPPAATSAMSSQAPSSPASPPQVTPPSAETSGPVETAPSLDPQLETRTYEASLEHFREANYAAAIAGFKGFLKAYPASGLAPNAQYWIGYSYYALKDYKSALAHQQKLIAIYPANAKVPDAMLNIASNMIALDDLPSARKTMEELVARYPGTNAADLATRRLAALK